MWGYTQTYGTAEGRQSTAERAGAASLAHQRPSTADAYVNKTNANLDKNRQIVVNVQKSARATMFEASEVENGSCQPGTDKTR